MNRKAPISRARRQAWRFGRLAEALAAVFLRIKGYRILARDFRTPVGEIDLVARRSAVLAFVEVKARDTAATEVLTRRQRRRIERSAEAFLRLRPDLADLEIRFDLMLMQRWRRPRHIAAAWRKDE